MSITTAEQLEANEQYDKAYEEYKKIYAKKPDSTDILERLGHLAMILDKKEEAADYYHKLLKIDPSDTMAYEQLMDIYIHTDRYRYYISRGNLHVVQQEISHAVNDFKKALDKAQNDEETSTTRFMLANLYEQVGKNHQAIDEYLRILDTKAMNEIVYLKLAQIYVLENSVVSAIETLERARENGFDTVNIKENLAQLYIRNNQPEKARGLTQDELVKVKSLLEEEKNETAFDVLTKIKSDNLQNPQYFSLLAQYYFNTKNWEKSLEAVNEFEKLDKNSPLVYQMKALIFEESGNDFYSHMNWAKYYLMKNDKDVALNEYFSAYQTNDSDVILVRNIAELLEEMNDKTQASEFWEKLAKLDSNNRKALEKVAEFKQRIGDYRAEAEVLQNLYELDNKNSLVVKKLATAYEKTKNKDKALEFYKRFIEISPVNDEYQTVQAKIKQLENAEMVEDEGLLGKIMNLFSKK